MMGVFVQVNTNSRFAQSQPIGYVIQEDGCWEWKGNKNPGGYGQLWSPTAMKPVSAHRWMYEQVKGPIPKGLHIDHLCRKRDCVNPDHMEPVTSRENAMRGVGLSAVNAKKTHCSRGHRYEEGNFRLTKRNQRVCIECSRFHRRLWTARHGQAQKHTRRSNG